MATMMNKAEFPSIGETIWTGVLSNGLSVFVVPKKGFRSCYALFGTHYGGAMRNFELEGKVHETPEGIAHYHMNTPAQKNLCRKQRKEFHHVRIRFVCGRF